MSIVKCYKATCDRCEEVATVNQPQWSYRDVLMHLSERGWCEHRDGSLNCLACILDRSNPLTPHLRADFNLIRALTNERLRDDTAAIEEEIQQHPYTIRLLWKRGRLFQELRSRDVLGVGDSAWSEGVNRV